jgi:hypothetical protein
MPDLNPGLQDNDLVHYHWATTLFLLSYHLAMQINYCRNFFMGRIIYEISCPLGELSIGQVIHAARCPWDQLSMGRVDHGTSCPWGELSMGRAVFNGRVVHGGICPWGVLSMGRVVMGRVAMGRIIGESSSYLGAWIPYWIEKTWLNVANRSWNIQQKINKIW